MKFVEAREELRKLGQEMRAIARAVCRHVVIDEYASLVIERDGSQICPKLACNGSAAEYLQWLLLDRGSFDRFAKVVDEYHQWVAGERDDPPMRITIASNEETAT